MEFRTILKRVSEQFNVEIAELLPSNKKLNEKNEENIYGPITTKNYETVRSIERLKQWIEDIRYHGYVAFDTETTGLDERKPSLSGYRSALSQVMHVTFLLDTKKASL